jgi:hypothetical protein
MEALIAKHRSEGMVWVQLGPLFNRGPEALDSALTMYKASRDLLMGQSALKQQDSPSGK